jgi:hypothetical protein
MSTGGKLLRRLPGERYSEVRPFWSGDTVAILAGGPSLTEGQVAKVRLAHSLRRLRAIAVNDAYLLAPWADVHYAADSSWHKWHTEGIEKPALKLAAADVAMRWKSFAGEKCSIQGSGDNIIDRAVHLLRNKTFPDHGTGLSRDPRALMTGRHSGFQALNLAVLAAATQVLLLGFDGRVGTDGRSHWFGEHPRPTDPAVFEHMRRAFSAAERDLKEAGVRVVNCSPASAIDSFEKRALDEALELLPA